MRSLKSLCQCAAVAPAQWGHTLIPVVTTACPPQGEELRSPPASLVTPQSCEVRKNICAVQMLPQAMCKTETNTRPSFLR